jgi:hypothetical protein
MLLSLVLVLVNYPLHTSYFKTQYKPIALANHKPRLEYSYFEINKQNNKF